MSDAKPKEKESVTDLVQALPRKIFTHEAALWVVALLLGGVAFAQGMDRLDGGVERKLAPIEKRVDGVEGELADVKKTSAEALRVSEQALRVSMETNLNVRLIAERMKIQPITLEPADGGR